MALRLVAGAVVLVLAACVVAPWLGNGATAMLLLFGGPLYVIVVYDVRRAREREAARRRAVLRRAAAMARHDAANEVAVAEITRRNREAGR